jgi:predicted metal-binding membrane protein
MSSPTALLLSATARAWLHTLRSGAEMEMEGHGSPHAGMMMMDGAPAAGAAGHAGTWMLTATVIIFVEKTHALGHRLSRPAGAAMAGGGMVLLGRLIV